MLSVWLPPNVKAQNGWCRSGLSVNITGEEPLNGYQILVVEGLLNGINFACSGANCVVPIVEDGSHSLEFWAISDYGDSSRKGTLNVNLDSQPPVADPIVSGTLGQNGWYTSPTVRLSLSATDATSGLALVQIQADGGDWQSVNDLEVNGEGQHTLAYRVQDVAGHEVAESYRANIDLSPPVTSFSKPNQGGITVQEEVSLQGKSTDSASGVAEVEISLNCGNSWRTLSTDANGNWTYTWDTTQVHNGKYCLMARARDLAGWQGDAVEMTVHVQNEKPQISLPVQWMIWEAINPVVEAGSAPIDRITLSVSDPKGRWAERKYDWDSSTPGGFTWDRQFGDGVTAPPGSYTVTLKAWDIAGNMSQARGEIVIPLPPTATKQPTSTDPVPSKTPTSQATTTSVSERVMPTNETKEKGAARTTSPVNSIRPTIRPTIDTQPQVHESSLRNQPTTRSNIRWGSAAAALAGAATAYALARKRRREAKGRQRRKAKRRAARRVKHKPAFAGDLSDEEVRAQIKAAGGNPNMDINEARALIHNARKAAVVRAAKEKTKQQQVPTSKSTRPADPTLHLTAEDWLAAKGKYDKLRPPSEETMEQVGNIPASQSKLESTVPVPLDKSWKEQDGNETTSNQIEDQRSYRWKQNIAKLLGKMADSLKSIADPTRNPRIASLHHDFWQGAQAWGEVLDIWKETIHFTANAVSERRWSDAGRGIAGLTKESLTLANASFKALGQVVWGLVSTPYRIFAHDIPEFRDAARERAEGKDRFWDVLFTGTSIMGDITALYGGYQLAGKTGIVNKIEGYNTIYPHRTIL